MNITELKIILEANPAKGLRFILPDKTAIPGHFHITEVGPRPKGLHRLRWNPALDILLRPTGLDRCQ